MNYSKRALLCSALCGSIAFAAAASAQTDAPAAAETNEITDIVVTAQKRSESISKVPMSITAATGDQLRDLGVRDVTELAKVVPGFTFSSSAYATPIYAIRGIGFNESSLGVKPTVGVYVDEVPLPLPVLTSGAALDLERVEVLKGPQGTLFGANTTGGAVNYIAAKPTRSLEAGVDARYGRFGAVDLSGFVSGPVSETMGIRLAASTEQGGAWQRSYTRDDTLGTRNKVIGRMIIHWEPAAALRFSLNANFYDDHGDEQAAQLIAVTLQNGRPVPSAHVPLLDIYLSAPNNGRAADWNPNRAYKRDNKFRQLALRSEADISDTITLTSLTSYVNYREDRSQDPDGTALENIEYTRKARINSFNQELRLAGSEGPFKWMLGVNYEDIKVDENNNGRVGYNNNVFLGPFSFATYQNNSYEHFDTRAAFGNVDYELGGGLTIHAGGRYSRTKIDFVGCTADGGDGGISTLFGGYAPFKCITYAAAPFGSPQGPVSKTLAEDNFSWRVGIDFKPAASTLLYANASKGYKAGSFPNLSAFSGTQYQPVTQESVLAYEAGFKTTLADRTLQLSGAAFYYDYTNKQVRGRVTAPVFVSLEALVNVPKSRVLGAELQMLWKPFSGLIANVGGTYIDSKILRNFTNYDPYSRITNFGGQQFPLTSRWQGNADLAYNFRVSDALGGFVGTNVQFRSRTNGGLGALPILAIDGYTLVDLRAGIEDADGKWRASVWANNVTNKFYWTAANHISDTTVRFAGMPATYGVSLSFRLK